MTWSVFSNKSISKKCSTWTQGSLSFIVTSATRIVMGARLVIWIGELFSDDTDRGLFLKSGVAWWLVIGSVSWPLLGFHEYFEFIREERLRCIEVSKRENMKGLYRVSIVKGFNDEWDFSKKIWPTSGDSAQVQSKHCILLNLCPGSQSIYRTHVCSAPILTKLIGR